MGVWGLSHSGVQEPGAEALVRGSEAKSPEAESV